MVKINYRLFFWLIILIGVLLGTGQLVGSAITTESTLIINEFLAANKSGLLDEDGDFSDWIEIYNPEPYTVNLAGFALTDDPNQPDKWPFPNISLGSHQYLVVFASGKNRRSLESGTPLHTNFKLEKDGEFLALYNILDEKLIVAEFSTQYPDISYGRYYDEPAYGYLTTATPGQPNNAAILWKDTVTAVNFSAKRGFYDTPFPLELTTGTTDATVRYTTDGSDPTETNGLIYTQPIPINTTTLIRAAAFKPNWRPSNISTHTYIFLDDILTQPANPPNFPETWGVHDETIKGYVSGDVVHADYEMDPEIVNAPGYHEILKDGLTSIPSISIVTDMKNLDIYSQPTQEGRDWERPASIELIDPERPDQGFQVDAGIRIHGDLGREEYMHKHSFRLFFRNEYGPGQLEYPLFPDSPVEQFNTLVLRAGVQDSYLGLQGLRRRNSTYTRDEWMRVSQVEMSGFGPHGRFVHLYLNGLYWGLYNIVERPDHSFASSHFKVNKDNWFAFNHGGNINVSNEEVRELLEGFLYANTPEEKYAALEPIIDTTAFADYVILNWYAGTGEWAENNWYAGFQNPDGKIKYFVWDGELTWDGTGGEVDFGKSNPPGYLWPNTVELFFEALIQNPDFKMEFADRLYKHLYNDGALTDANAQARLIKINDEIDRAIAGEFARWGDSKQKPPHNRDDWLQATDNILAQMEGNANRLIALTRDAGYYPKIDPPTFGQQGGLVEAGFELTMIPPLYPPLKGGEVKGGINDGIIFYTTDGSDPRTRGTGMVSPNAKVYEAPILLTTTTHLKARLFTGDPASPTTEQVWSALNEATFSLVERDPKLRITEIMYNPPGPDDTEFIELKNTGNGQIDLSGLSFEGIRFTFPTNTPPLSPGEFITLVRNRQAFAERYSNISIDGVYSGQLSNKGEEIILKDTDGNPILSVNYDDENGWPLSPDGRGDSLVLIDPNADPNNPRSWRASTNLNGSPGTDDLNYRLN